MNGLTSFFYPIVKLGFRNIYRKESLVGESGGRSVLQRQLVNEVVKSGSQIVQTIPDHEGKRWINRLALCKPNNNLLPVRLVVKDDGLICSGIATDQQPQSRVDISEMVLRSANFGAD
jgi:hypothetical protein